MVGVHVVGQQRYESMLVDVAIGDYVGFMPFHCATFELFGKLYVLQAHFHQTLRGLMHRVA